MATRGPAGERALRYLALPVTPSVTTASASTQTESRWEAVEDPASSLVEQVDALRALVTDLVRENEGLTRQTLELEKQVLALQTETDELRKAAAQASSTIGSGYIVLQTARLIEHPCGLHRMAWPEFAARLHVRAGHLQDTPGLFFRRVRSTAEMNRVWASEGFSSPVPVVV